MSIQSWLNIPTNNQGATTQFLQERQAVWLVDDSDFPIELTTALIFHVFAFDFVTVPLGTFQGVTVPQLKSRTVDDWERILGSPIEECSLLLPGRKAQEPRFATNGVSEVVSSSAQAWNENATLPPAADVSLGCAEFLAEHRFIRLYD